MKGSSVKAIRTILGLGALVFAISAVALLIAPQLFAELLGIATTPDVSWSLRLMGAVLVALAGQMFLVRRGSDQTVRRAAIVMIVGGGLMTVVTVIAPGDATPLRYAYAVFGAVFCLAYVIALLRWRQASNL
jgi:peptidoglycan/LPS O-acetylase OafA/YrhL